METVVYMARLTRDLSDGERERLLGCLPPARRTRLERARAGQRETLCAYGLLCAALWRTLRWTALPPVALSAAGKPYFPDFPGVQFSVSHTDGAVMAGLSPEPIGVDIERVRPMKPRFMRRTAGTDDVDAFFRYWVAAEACGKRDGVGVAGVLHGRVTGLSDAGFRAADAFPGYAAGVAVCPGLTPRVAGRYVV